MTDMFQRISEGVMINWDITDEFREEQYQKFKKSIKNDPISQKIIQDFVKKIFIEPIEDEIFSKYLKKVGQDVDYNVSPVSEIGLPIRSSKTSEDVNSST